jgi:phosphate transport system ATP-binding protein
MNTMIPSSQSQSLTGSNGAGEVIIDCKIDNLYYGKFLAVRDSHMPIEKGKITAFIGPSGCGKSTALRCLNRMNDLVRGFRFEGHVHFRGKDIYAARIDPVVVRRYIGMVFQQPNPFAMSIFNNVAFGLRLNRYRGDTSAKVEQALRSAALWDEVKDKLKNNGLSLSGGQQQRLCIARAIATRRIEELMHELKQKYTIAVVTHNLQQAMRVADKTAFMYVDTSRGGRTGYLVEYRDTKEMFDDPKEQFTKQYIRGEFS